MTTNSTLSKDYRILCELGRNQYFDIILKASSPKREMRKKKNNNKSTLIASLYWHLSSTYTLSRSLSLSLARLTFNARKIAFEFCKSLIMSENSEKKPKHYRTKGIN